MKGFNGRIARVNLTTGSITTKNPSEDFYRAYFGGRGFIGYYLNKEVKPGVDPYSPDNLAILSVGPITGSSIPGSSRSSIGAKSPMSGGFGSSEAGGFFPAEFKRAGFDAMLITGKAAKPTYIYVHDGEIELRDASKVWGMLTGEAEAAIQAELGDKGVRTALIGPSGEKLVRFAAVFNDVRHTHGRGGMGAVFGSKNLKGVVARGHGRPQFGDPVKMQELMKFMHDNYRELSRGNVDIGTGASMVGNNLLGGTITENFADGVFEGTEKMCAETLVKEQQVDREGCFACPIKCKRVCAAETPYKVDPLYGGAEYETLAAFGSNCKVDDLVAISKAHEICNAYGIDSISGGGVVAFAMEAFEKGLLTQDDTDGLDMHFGNAAAMVAATQKMATRDGKFGDFLAEGTRIMARKLGRGAEEFAIQTKGLEAGMHDPRYSQGQRLNFSVGPSGADHGANVSAWTTFSKDTSVFCGFVRYTEDQLVELNRAATGWDMSKDEMLTVGQRALTLARLYNLQEGFSVTDDKLCPRFYTHLKRGPKSDVLLTHEQIDELVQGYYAKLGWDSQGVPTAETLDKLGITWAARP